MISWRGGVLVVLMVGVTALLFYALTSDDTSQYLVFATWLWIAKRMPFT